MTQSSSLLSFLLLVVANILVQPNQCVLAIDRPALNFDDLSSSVHKFPSIIVKSRDVVNRFRCAKEWRRFGGSCYYLSNVTSTAAEANDTCNLLYSNDSQLMHIRHSIELLYTAHILVKNNLSTLLVEIDPHLFKGKEFRDVLSMNDTIKWQSAEDKFRRARINYYKRKIKASGQSRREEKLRYDSQIGPSDDTQAESQSTTTATENEKDDSKEDNIDSFSADDSEPLDGIRHVCDQLAWNGLKQHDSRVFILSRYLISDKMICSLNDIDSNVRYQHMCQYVLDFCFDNDMCGKHGRCVNKLAGFECSCGFLYDGSFCEKFSTTSIQLLVGLLVVFLLFVLSTERLQKYQRLHIKRFIDVCKPQPTTPDCPQDTEITADGSVEHTPECQRKSQEDNVVRSSYVGGLMFFILCLLCTIPTIYHLKSFQLHNIDPSKFNKLINDNIRVITQCERNSILRTDNQIFFFISVALCIIFSLMNKQKTNSPNCCACRPGLLSPIEPFKTSNRYETAALAGIVMIEVLTFLEHFLIDLSELWDQGVLKHFFVRTLVPLLYSIRYYPIFVSLQQRSSLVRFLAFIYVMGNITYIIIRGSSCMDFLSLSKRFSKFDEARRRVELGTWAILYGLIKNMPQFLLLSYIGAELSIRFAYDSIYITYMKKPSAPEEPITPSDGFQMHHLSSLDQNASGSDSLDQNSSSSDTLDSISCWSSIRKFIDSIYRWPNDFQFTTMAMCTYTVAFALIFYLTCIFAFQSIMGTSFMSFLKFCLNQIVNIEIEDWSFHCEIILSAILTMIIFYIHLVIGMKKYKDHTDQLQQGVYGDIPLETEHDANSIAPKSVGYLASVFLNIVGGFFIWFHMILFIVITLRLILFHLFIFQMGPLEPLYSLFLFFTPVFVLYGLKKYITQWFCIFTFPHQSENGHNSINDKVYGIQVYFTIIISFHIAIFSCILRLITGTLFNVLLMPRIDCSYLARPVEKFDSGYDAYVCLLHMEKAYRQPTHPAQLSVRTNNVTEVQMTISREESDRSELVQCQDTANSVDTQYVLGEVVEEDSSRSPSPIQPDDSDDAVSIISSTYERVLPGDIIATSGEQTPCEFDYVQYQPPNSRQISERLSTIKKTDERASKIQPRLPQHDSKSTASRITISNEQEPLLDTAEDKTPELPPKKDPKRATKSRDKLFQSTDV